jgi:putative tricarboxylic transport membrane protein
MNRRWVFVGEVLFGCLILVCGIVALTGSVQLGFGSLAQPGAGLFPFFSGLMIVIAAPIVIANSIFGRVCESEIILKKDGFRTLAGVMAVFAAWILAMPTLGYVVVTFAAVLVLAKLLGLEGWLKPLALSAATSFATYILFDRLLYLDLPRGLLLAACSNC